MRKKPYVKRNYHLEHVAPITVHINYGGSVYKNLFSMFLSIFMVLGVLFVIGFSGSNNKQMAG